ncbi:MAG: oleate hydratase [Ignavibacteriales bacterium]|nr:oleate hydratase [Ignavibacteriales bacterium]
MNNSPFTINNSLNTHISNLKSHIEVIIIGGGLSGLAAAVELASHGAQVTLFEQSPKLGGRCYSFIDEKTGDVVDNGQHVLVGAYHNTLRYLEMIGTRSLLKEQNKLSLPFFHPQKGFHTFSVSSLPKPFHLTTGMLKFSLLSFWERKRLLNVGLDLQQWNQKKEELLAHLTIDEWLTSLNQSEEAKKCFWNPISISVMNELPERASALLFARSLRSTFLGKKSVSAMLIPTVGQTELYATPAEEFLKQHKAKIHLNSPVEKIICKDGKAIGLEVGGKFIKAGHIICAVPYFALPGLLPDDVKRIEPFTHIDKIKSSPIVSIHLWFEKEFIEEDFVGLVRMKLQWIFNRRKIIGSSANSWSPPAGGLQLISAVISGAHEEVKLSKDELVSLALNDINKIFTETGNRKQKTENRKLLHSIVIKEKRATFSPTNENERFRPNTISQIDNLFLAGDWTNTGLPATIEGAVMSGFEAGRTVLSSLQQTKNAILS